MKRTNVTLQDIARWRKQGKGLGSGKDYKPWVEVRDVPSKGRSHRTKGIKTGRNHHLLSDLEYHHFLFLEYNSQVIDIREQFPLFPIDNAMSIAKSLSIPYPLFIGTQTPYVMTTDFVVSIQNGNGSSRLHARQIKYEKDLEDKRTMEKLEIDRVFWKMLGVSWDIGVDNLNAIMTNNLMWLHPHLSAIGNIINAQKILNFMDAFASNCTDSISLTSLIKLCASKCKIQYQEAMLIFRYLTWHKHIPFDIENTKIELRSHVVLTHPITEIQTVPENMKA